MLDDGRPGGVELSRGRGRAPSGHAVGLLDQRDAESLRQRHVGRRDEIARADSASRPVTENEGGPLALGRMQIDIGGAVRRCDLEHRPKFIPAQAPGRRR